MEEPVEEKKLSNKERRALKKAEDAQRREEEEAAAAADETSNFTVVQSGTGEISGAAALSNDIKVEKFSISAKGTKLFDDASLTIVAGRRYGLVGPNGQGKTTLLKHLGLRKLAFPEHIDALYVEQEVVADETPAIEVVLRADVKRAALLLEEKKLNALREAFDARAEGAVWTDDHDVRLRDIFEDLAALDSAAAEPRARMILPV